METDLFKTAKKQLAGQQASTINIMNVPVYNVPSVVTKMGVIKTLNPLEKQKTFC